MSAQNLRETLRKLKGQRLSGELSPEAFYRELLQLGSQLLRELAEEGDRCQLSGSEIGKQTSLILAFLISQIDLLAQREEQRWSS